MIISNLICILSSEEARDFLLLKLLRSLNIEIKKLWFVRKSYFCHAISSENPEEKEIKTFKLISELQG